MREQRMYNGNMIQGVLIAKVLTLEPYEKPVANSAENASQLREMKTRGRCETYDWRRSQQTSSC